MKIELYPFQENKLDDLHDTLESAIDRCERTKQLIVLSAPTGAGKTLIATALMEGVLHGYKDWDADPNSIFIWLSDSPQLNVQTRDKIEHYSDKIRTHDVRFIESSFDAEYFDAGCIYFINFQKLGTDKLLASNEGDRRNYTLWQTLTNTANRQPKSFFVIIDEAHRGTQQSQNEFNRANSIMQKFIMGSPDDGLIAMPIIIGITATPNRLTSLAAGLNISIHNVIVPPGEVRSSGLLKDWVLFDFPKNPVDAEMTMFKEAIQQWKLMCKRWSEYSNDIKPIFVVQVENGSGNKITNTDLSACIKELKESCVEINEGDIVHTFDTHMPIEVDNYSMNYIEPSHIEEDSKVKVVFFKVNLSTGWDCPRAEVMMSFRRASDHTNIAQLLGRMVRTPLAKRVETDEELNNVYLFLPDFDKETVANVVQSLQSNENVPVSTGNRDGKIVLIKNSNIEEHDVIFSLMARLPTYKVDTPVKQTAIERLFKLAYLLSKYEICESEYENTKIAILDEIARIIDTLKEQTDYISKAQALEEHAIQRLALGYLSEEDSIVSENRTRYELHDYDWERMFKKAGRIIGEGLHTDYLERNIDYKDKKDIWTEIILFSRDDSSMLQLSDFAKSRRQHLYNTHRPVFSVMEHDIITEFDRVAESQYDPEPKQLQVMDTIVYSSGYIGDNADVYEKHLYVPEDGSAYRISLNDWEDPLIKAEMEKEGFIAWFRNLDRKPWSLQIPYTTDAGKKPHFPDFIIVRKENGNYKFDILDPHYTNDADFCARIKGIVEFADDHGGRYGRIQHIRKEAGEDGQVRLYRLDINDVRKRDRLRNINDIGELNRVFIELREPE